MSNIITIDTITIKQDSEGRFCLNDFHKAAGGNPNHAPAQFFRTDTAQALITELSNCAEMHITPWLAQRGFNGGTYVVRELVFAYAMWVSPAFHLKVIRAYDRLQTQGVAVADHAAADLLKNPLKYLEAIIGQAKELQAQLDVAQPKAAVLDAVVADKRVDNFLMLPRTVDYIEALEEAYPNFQGLLIQAQRVGRVGQSGT
ncbi:KilA-N domain-containing protein [Dechloromonas sp.]|uniref:KilA-N domain-containing protein n=1 Tax=Dechloromonas sp. TaxID=1917218 RepID=UPI002173FAE0|nr:KilA-N domain-containing protein [Dechloromonas sp.]MBU3696767.1 KilA-N domain-containing protein [Dechloromonas sp.]